MAGIAGPVERIPVIETQRADRQIEADTDTEVRSEAVEGAVGHQRIEWQSMEFCILHAGLLVDAGRPFQSLVAEIPRVRIDQTNVVKYRAPRLFDNGKGHLRRRADHRLTANWLTIGILRADIAKTETAQVVGSAKIEPVENWDVRNNFINLLSGLLRRVTTRIEDRVTVDIEDLAKKA